MSNSTKNKIRTINFGELKSVIIQNETGIFWDGELITRINRPITPQNFMKNAFWYCQIPERNRSEQDLLEYFYRTWDKGAPTKERYKKWKIFEALQ